MEIKISDQALSWFKDEVELKEGDTVKFQAKYGGYSPIHEGFSLAFQINEKPDELFTKTEKDGITFFIDTTDAWYFKGYDLIVQFNEELEEVAYDYKKVS
ncbi:HesB/YadR/YfhF family protein [Gracilibacillus sp. YIM 98692]|uniref:HesB/YadR/YfhF family protein n=1 Tax=Gracilibacillus sp. YIM 98692 TaxID=2663532 RepID=UPI0013D20751|nr:HesB/YadR/YfhF family protein [Gracilibacillus sp. YIM 98692]